MQQFISAITLTLLAAGVALAADTISLPAKNGNVAFNHKQHQEALKNCTPCHEKGGGKIEGFGKDLAHKSCKGCHEEMKKGPTSCSGCHKK